MLNALVRFADDTQGLEKSLRLLQGFCTIAVGLVVSAEDADFWIRIRSQFALGRRYFRLLKWHPCWSNALQATGATNKQPLITMLEVTKWSFLGMYFFLEMFTISNAMGVTAYDWGPRVQREANKCWFISLLFSILLSLLGLWDILIVTDASPDVKKHTDEQRAKDVSADTTDGTTDRESSNETSEEPANQKRAQIIFKTQLYSQLIIDSCDLFIPGAAVGWLPAGPILVGTLSTVSTSLAGRQIWKRVQERAQQV